jgi:hypothetical protein
VISAGKEPFDCEYGFFAIDIFDIPLGYRLDFEFMVHSLLNFGDAEVFGSVTFHVVNCRSENGI